MNQDWFPLLCGIAAVVAAVSAVAWSVLGAGRRGPVPEDRVGLLLERRGSGRHKGATSRWPRFRDGVPVSSLVYRRPTAIVAGAGVALVAGTVLGGFLGAAVSLAVCLWQRRSPGAAAAREAPGARAEAVRVRGQLPAAADLLAACMDAGAGLCEATEAVGRSVGDPLGGMLLRVAAELRLGADPARSWARFGTEPGAAALGRCLERACRSGASPVRQVDALAEDCRATEARAGQARARRAGILATAPLGLCFLPAFLLVGVAPMVIGIARTILAPV